MSRNTAAYTRQVTAADLNLQTVSHYLTTLKSIACSRFKWENLPPEIDARFLELALYEFGLAVFFHDSKYDKYFALQGAQAGRINMYRNSTYYRVTSPDTGALPFSKRLLKGYVFGLDEAKGECVPIWCNFLRMPDHNSIAMFARRLADLDRSIEVNHKAQKTPVLIECPEELRLTAKALYSQYDGNVPVIFGTTLTQRSNSANGLVFNAIKTDAPYVADKMLVDKGKIWAEAMTFLGVDNANTDKRERLVTEEVQANNGQIELMRLIGLEARRQACEQINRLYGLNVSVNFNYDILSMNHLYHNDDEAHDKLIADTVTITGDLTPGSDTGGGAE